MSSLPRGILVITCLCFFLEGCIFAPLLDSISKTGVRKTDRQAILSEQAARFHDALYWGNVNDTLSFVVPEKRSHLEPILKGFTKNRRVIDAKAEDLDFSEDSYSAVVSVRLRSYKIPYYVVEDKIQIEKWVFSLSDNWMLEDITEELPK